MAKNSRGKRPCSVCRQWFQSDVHQKGRQKTCGNPDCKREQHRRQCEKWNRKNRDYFKTNYLDKKIEAVQEALPDEPPIANNRHPFILPYEIIINEYGAKHLVILRYLIFLVIQECRVLRPGAP
jgi:hypothetical protein